MVENIFGFGKFTFFYVIQNACDVPNDTFLIGLTLKKSDSDTENFSITRRFLCVPK